MSTATPRTIVVGVDATPAAYAAAQWAAREAALRDARLVLVHVYNPLPAGLLAAPMPQEVFDDVRAQAEAVVAQCAEAVHGDRVTTRVVAGAPGPVLEAAAADADLLVVGGGKPHHAAVRLALGSVAQHCVNHAGCPVVVVPPPRNARQVEEPDLAAAQT